MHVCVCVCVCVQKLARGGVDPLATQTSTQR